MHDDENKQKKNAININKIKFGLTRDEHTSVSCLQILWVAWYESHIHSKKKEKISFSVEDYSPFEKKYPSSNA